MFTKLLTSNNKQRWYYIILFLTIIFYILLTFYPHNTSSNKAFGLSKEQIFLLQITIIIPYIASWGVGIYALLTLEKFIESVENKKDTFFLFIRSFQTGFLWIIMGSSLTSLIGAVRSYFMSNPTVIPSLTILTNYLYILFPLIGFIYLN